MLDWEENLFLGLKALYRQVLVRPEQRRREAVRATLRERRTTLLLLAEMLAGRPVGILETDAPALCGDGRIFLPAEISLAPSPQANGRWLALKAILGALALREEWCRPGAPLSERVASCATELPRLKAHLDAVGRELPPHVDVWQSLGELPLPRAHGARSAITATAPGTEPVPTTITTEIQGRGQADVTVVPGQNGDGVGADMPTHTFEKVETLEEYTGQSRKSDDEDELDDHAEALSAVKMTQVMRSPERPRSIYRGDLILDGATLDVADDGPARGIPYPEWDCRRREYRPDWCFVQEGAITTGRPDWAGRVAGANRALIHRLQRQFHALTSDWLRLRRQPAGAEFDLDALMDAEVERRTGHTPSEAVYLDRRRDLHDVAALVLLDTSYSTDAWLDNRRVLDVITESVFCVGEVLNDYLENLALAAFTSNTRRACRFDLLKHFREPWRTTRDRLGSLESCGYTRIGPALRHAHELLHNQPASRKIVILITDGRPCDYDRYEGDYGIQDIRKAIDRGRRHGIRTHAFAVEKQAAEAFPRMFSRNHFDILARPDALAGTLCKLFARLLAE